MTEFSPHQQQQPGASESELSSVVLPECRPTTLDSIRLNPYEAGGSLFLFIMNRVVDVRQIPVIRHLLDPWHTRLFQISSQESAEPSSYQLANALDKPVHQSLAREVLNESHSVSWRRDALSDLVSSVYGKEPDWEAPIGAPNAVAPATYIRPVIPESDFLLLSTDAISRSCDGLTLTVYLDWSSFSEWIEGVHTVKYEFSPNPALGLPTLHLLYHAPTPGDSIEVSKPLPRVSMRVAEWNLVYQAEEEDIFFSRPRDYCSAVESMTSFVLSEGVRAAADKWCDTATRYTFPDIETAARMASSTIPLL